MHTRMVVESNNSNRIDTSTVDDDGLDRSINKIRYLRFFFTIYLSQLIRLTGLFYFRSSEGDRFGTLKHPKIYE